MSDYEKNMMKKMDWVIRLLVASVIADSSKQKDHIVKLSSVGFQPTEIAEILGTTSNSVNVALSRARSKGLI
ncbi:MAG: sigma factor-like helix-turn-helix DNA-binding protein [Candidatus Hodarchaeales archaeon]